MKQHRFPKLPLLAALAVVALLAGACSSDDDSSGDDGSAGEAVAVTEGERSTGAPEVPEECESGDADGAAAAVEERGAPDPSLAGEVTGDEGVSLVEGEGEEVPEGASVRFHYIIVNTADGSVLESSWEAGSPTDVPLDQVFPTFAENVAGMKVGGRRAFTLAAEEIAGDPPAPESGLAPGDTVVMIVDVIATVGTDQDALDAAEARGAPEMEVPEGDAETEELVVIENVEGDGDVVCPGDTVVAHYTGIQASDGEEFDSSWQRGEPAEFSLDGVIQGWSEGLVGMQVGGRRTLVIPAEQAYGEEAAEGRPGGVLVFTVDMVGAG